MSYRQMRLGGTWTPTIAALVGVNVVLFIAKAANPVVTEALALVPGMVWPGRIYTLITYAFLHASVGHIFFNMLTLYFFGGDLENFLGRRRFLILYLGSALAGGLAAALFLPESSIVVGASGAIYGVLAAYAVYFPQTRVLLWFLVPMKIWVLVSLWIGISVFYSVFGGGGNIAHLAHLGGAIFGLAYTLRLWRPTALLRDLKYRWRRRRFKRLS